MTQNLDRRAVDRLKETLEERLSKVQVTKNMFLLFSTVADWNSLDKILPGVKSAVRKELTSFIGDEPFSDFAIGRLSDWLYERTYESDKEVEPLSALADFSDLSATAERIVDEFCSLPWQYTLLTPVPHLLSEELLTAMGDRQVQLSDHTRLVMLRGEEAELDRDPPRPRGLLEIQTPDLHDDVLYFSSVVRGYIPRFGSSTPLEEFRLNVKGFFGLLLAFNIARPGTYSSFGRNKRKIYVYRHDSSARFAQEPQELSDDAGETIRSLGLTEPFLAFPEEARRHLLGEELDKFREVFSDSQNAYILRAAQWLFDSHSGDNKLLSFVQAAVALEILFGDKGVSDLVGLGELLGNRCAYLIGVTREQREELLADFRRIYDTRSRIVHRGHTLLSAAEKRDLITLRWMCARSIRRELELVVAKAPS